MKILMFYCKRFWYKVGRKSLAVDSSMLSREWECKDCSVIYIHVEKEDEEKGNSVVQKLVKNIVWHARKTGASTIVLHSFAHLSESKADPEAAKNLIFKAKEKLEKKGFDVHVTPFGYFLEFVLHVYDTPISRVFKSL